MHLEALSQVVVWFDEEVQNICFLELGTSTLARVKYGDNHMSNHCGCGSGS